MCTKNISFVKIKKKNGGIWVGVGSRVGWGRVTADVNEELKFL